MAENRYLQFCPVSMAAEILCSRWTILLLRELIAGSTRFNDLRRGLPRMSPALLSKRLREMEVAGLVQRVAIGSKSDIQEYQLTAAGRDLKGLVETFGSWGQKWVESDATLRNLDVNLLMWDMRRNIRTDPMPRKRTNILFTYAELPPAQRKWWLLVEPGEDVDLCLIDPGFDVDLYVNIDLETMTRIWLGYEKVSMAKKQGRLHITGNHVIERAIEQWLGLSPFAKVQKIVA
ncbi:MAG: helix-turn-helix domain-containing protein [Parvibaculum sp.]|nr:helix-turn-helix domain-containing protein [Parvibaculum sp.]